MNLLDKKKILESRYGGGATESYQQLNFRAVQKYNFAVSMITNSWSRFRLAMITTANRNNRNNERISPDRLFRHISSKTHCLHHLLPPQRNVRTASSLRTRGHNFTFPQTDSNLYKKFFYQSLSFPVPLTPSFQVPAPATSSPLCTTTSTLSQPLSLVIFLPCILCY